MWAKWGRNRGCYGCNDTGVSDQPWRQRNYDVFGMLAGVRVGDWKVISDGRGFPKNLATKFDIDGDPDDVWWPGDHSYGFATLAELQAYDWWQTKTDAGVVGLSVFARWNRITAPPWYSGGVSGGSIKHVTMAEADKHLRTNPAPALCLDYFEPSNTYVTDCEWLQTAAQAAGNFVVFVAEMTNLARREKVDNDDVRLVFGFDS
jgi:hypothetical protein